MEDQSRWGHKAGSLKFQTRHYAIVEAAQVKTGMRVLDVATGRGEVAIIAASKGARVHAVDISLSLVQCVEQNASTAGVQVSAAVDDMRDLRTIHDRYDLVLGCAALHHLDEEGVRKAVLSAIRVLAPGGRALFLEPVGNIRWFETVKSMFPRGDRPSILNRPCWKRWLLCRDDRPMSDLELLSAWTKARIIGRAGLFVRILRTPLIERIDEWLLRWNVLQPLAQTAIVEYRR